MLRWGWFNYVACVSSYCVGDTGEGEGAFDDAILNSSGDVSRLVLETGSQLGVGLNSVVIGGGWQLGIDLPD